MSIKLKLNSNKQLEIQHHDYNNKPTIEQFELASDVY